MKIGIEGSTRADLFRVSPESIYIPGLDPHPETGEVEPLENFSPYHRLRIKKPLDEDLIASLMEHGHMQPVLTEKPLRNNNTFLSTLDGVQRIRNGRVANQRLVKRGDKPNLVEITVETDVTPERRLSLMMGSNILRTDEEDSAHAEMAWWMLKVKKMDVGTVAGLFRKKKSTINQWMMDYGFSDEIKAELQSGTMEKTTARIVASMPKGKQAAVIMEAKKSAAKKTGTRKDKVSVRDVLKASQKISTGFTAPSKMEMLAVIREGIPDDAMEVLLWATGQGPMPAFLERGESGPEGVPVVASENGVAA